MLPFLRRAAVVAALALLALVPGMAGALAHVSVSSPDATQGGYALIAFRVPSESATATTVSLTVQVPAGTPLSSARIKPLPGWTHTTTMQDLPRPITIGGREITQSVDTIVWTADDGVGLRADEFQEFQITAGPLPETDELVFKAVQGYSDGSRVDWIEQVAPGSTAEPDHPAPVLTLAAPAAQASADAADGDAGTSGLAAGALAVGLAALAAAGAALLLVPRLVRRSLVRRSPVQRSLVQRSLVQRRPGA